MLFRPFFICLISLQAQAELYRCTASSGDIQFTDQPCQGSGGTYEPKAVMTNYESIELPKSHKTETPPQEKATKKQACPFFSSTELRTLRIKDEFEKGLSLSHIQQRFGEPYDINHSENKSVFVYDDKNVKRIFRFKNGCLTSWKEKWKGKESQISKFRGER